MILRRGWVSQPSVHPSETISDCCRSILENQPTATSFKYVLTISLDSIIIGFEVLLVLLQQPEWANTHIAGWFLFL